MSFQQILMWMITLGTLIGAIDKIIGNRFGLGEKFDDGFHALGPLALGMVGILCLAPVIASLLKSAATAFFGAIGADPALAGCILAIDMGGYPLAMELASDPQAGLYAGIIVSSMLGCTLVFSIPVGLGAVNKEDRAFFARGLLIGLVTVPFGCLAGGIAAGFRFRMLLMNTLPIVILALILALGLSFFLRRTIRIFLIFSKVITSIVYAGLAAALFEALTGISLIPGMEPITEGFSVVAAIAIVLPGTYVMLALLTKLLHKPLNCIGNKAGLDTTSVTGLIMSMANPIPLFGMIKNMSKRGIIVNTAWLVSATAVFGDHLGFTAGVQPELVKAMIVGKLTGGILAVSIALLTTKKQAQTAVKE